MSIKFAHRVQSHVVDVDGYTMFLLVQAFLLRYEGKWRSVLQNLHVVLILLSCFNCKTLMWFEIMAFQRFVNSGKWLNNKPKINIDLHTSILLHHNDDNTILICGINYSLCLYTAWQWNRRLSIDTVVLVINDDIVSTFYKSLIKHWS